MAPLIDSAEGFVYFIWCEGMVKIGFCKSNLQRRVDELQIACPFPVEFLGAIQSDSAMTLEASFHARFEQFHVRGEWFKIPPDILRDVSRNFVKQPPFIPRTRREFFMLKTLLPMEMK